MKKLFTVFMTILIVTQITSITSFAKEESATELYKRDPDAFYKKYMCLDEEAQEQGLYSDANNGAFSKNKKSKSKNNSSQSYQSTSNYSYVGEAKGWVYSVDELHVVGLPEDPQTGYTRSGDYGIIR